jgi:hypothetical protein
VRHALAATVAVRALAVGEESREHALAAPRGGGFEARDLREIERRRG